MSKICCPSQRTERGHLPSILEWRSRMSFEEGLGFLVEKFAMNLLRKSDLTVKISPSIWSRYFHLLLENTPEVS